MYTVTVDASSEVLYFTEHDRQRLGRYWCISGIVYVNNVIVRTGYMKVGLRKKITNAVTELHKTQWKMPDDPLPFKRALRQVVLAYYGSCMILIYSLQEYSLVLSQLANHIRYVHGSTSFIIGHTSSKTPSPITMASEPGEVEELTNQIQAVVIASQHLKQEVSSLEQLVYDVRNFYI